MLMGQPDLELGSHKVFLKPAVIQCVLSTSMFHSCSFTITHVSQAVWPRPASGFLTGVTAALNC